jgi:hypothetical protein
MFFGSLTIPRFDANAFAKSPTLNGRIPFRERFSRKKCQRKVFFFSHLRLLL